MNFEEILDRMKNAQAILLEFIENEENIDENFIDLQVFLNEFIKESNKYEFISLLHLITNISNDHYRNPLFFTKIDKILKYIKDPIQNNFTNFEKINIFKSNKRILLFLIEEKLIFIDRYFVDKFTHGKYFQMKYSEYFWPEIKPFIHENWFINSHSNDSLIEKLSEEIPENFYEMRKIGENEDYIYELIRNDSIIEFTSYINKHSYPLESKVKSSIYETNSYLVKKQAGMINKGSIFFYNFGYDKDISLIEYAAFFGSLQIFQYLRINNVNLSQSLWFYAIHGKNAEIIHLLEYEDIVPATISYDLCFKESIKCHHNEIVDFLKNNHLSVFIDNSIETFRCSLKYHNYALIDINLINQYYFYELCQYDYPCFVETLLNNAYDEENKEAIKKKNIFFFNSIHPNQKIQ